MRKILVIEDEAAVLENIIEIVEEFDFQAFGAHDGTEGVKIASELIPDLIICDIMMPGLDGFGVLNKLQQDPHTATIPFIFLTAKADKEDLRLGMDLGADDYITKPFTPDQLYRAIKTRLKKQKQLEAKSEKRLDELRMNLASTLPHEFRTPLNGILASSQFLLEYFDSLEREEVEQLHQNIYTSAQRLHRLILNYLFYADLELLSRDKAQNNKLKDFVTFYPSEIVDSIFRKKASKENRRKDLEISIEDSSISIMQEHFLKICEEIADNCFKFSEAGDKIIVKAYPKDDYYILEVTDFGRGIKNEQIKKIGAYVQFDRGMYEQQGSGLGLTIIKKLADLYSGVFSINSKYGDNTIVRVELPKSNEEPEDL